MTTILGKHISWIRPMLGHRGRVYKDELPKIKYNKRSKKVKRNCGKVISVCVKLTNGAVRSLAVPATHFQVCEKMVVDVDRVAAIGWQLENGNFVWR